MTTHATLRSGGTTYRIVDLPAEVGEQLAQLPWLMRILLENVLRCAPSDEAVAARAAMLAWIATGTSTVEIPFSPARILMHDTTCLPALADVAAMRTVLARSGGDPTRLVPQLPVDVSVDHSLAVEHYGSANAYARNMAREIERNAERYRFMKWAGNVMPGLKIHPPGTGIMHTLNLEQLATVVATGESDGSPWAYPDTLIGTDSHTPMINGIGVLGWGVGGLEAEGAMFGLPVMLRIPDVIGVKLTGALPPGCLATDLALTVTERLRKHRLDSEFVEFFGPGVVTLTAGERAVVANMAPEFGGSSGYFPIDEQTCLYLVSTGRTSAQIALVEDYARRNRLWFDPAASPRYTDVIEIDLSQLETSVAGPRRPQDRQSPSRIPEVLAPIFGSAAQAAAANAPANGAIAIAAITSCTNTSDPALLIAAGLVARKARALGLKPPTWVKTSLAPGSPAARVFLERAGLMDDLAVLGFDIVGHGCTTCIGNSGPLAPVMAEAVERAGIKGVAVLSGNRNFPGRIHPDIDLAFLASPPLVVAFALAGTAMIDIQKDPVGFSVSGDVVRLADLWPTAGEVAEALAQATRPGDFRSAFVEASRNTAWNALEAPTTALFPWQAASTYIRPPPFATFLGAAGADGTPAPFAVRPASEQLLAYPLLVLGDDVTTDHISPAGQIPTTSDAGEHLISHQERPQDLNVYAARRGNWQVMLRGMFANRSLTNLLVSGIPGGQTVHAPSGERMNLWLAAERYAQEGTPVVILAGERYGTGSSRDWAAKGLALLGVRAVLAVSFERIHRTNLINMGILPLRLDPADHPRELALRPGDRIELDLRWQELAPRGNAAVTVHRTDGTRRHLQVISAVETNLEADILRAGGMLPMILSRATL